MQQNHWTERTENLACLLLKGMWDFPPVLYFYFNSYFHLEMNELFWSRGPSYKSHLCCPFVSSCVALEELSHLCELHILYWPSGGTHTPQDRCLLIRTAITRMHKQIGLPEHSLIDVKNPFCPYNSLCVVLKHVWNSSHTSVSFGSKQCVSREPGKNANWSQEEATWKPPALTTTHMPSWIGWARQSHLVRWFLLPTIKTFRKMLYPSTSVRILLSQLCQSSSVFMFPMS